VPAIEPWPDLDAHSCPEIFGDPYHIAGALNLELIAREAARPTEDPDALDYILRGRAALWKPATCENYADAICLFERAVALDPQSIDAQSWLASVLAWRMLDGITDTAAADIARAEELVGRALAGSPRSPLAHFAKGQLLRVRRRPEEAIPEYEWRSRLIATGWTL
jgi:tetratricopeptide (TPR) repeat protein